MVYNIIYNITLTEQPKNTGEAIALHEKLKQEAEERSYVLENRLKNTKDPTEKKQLERDIEETRSDAWLYGRIKKWSKIKKWKISEGNFPLFYFM